MSFAKLFARPHYTSPATDCLQALKQERPELDLAQRQGRALLWDKRIDREQQAEMRAGRIPPTGYVYYALPRHPKSDPA